MEEHSEVKVYEIDYKCPKCDIGYLHSDGIAKLSYPPIYTHTCTNSSCGHKEEIRGKNYPYIEYKKINT